MTNKDIIAVSFDSEGNVIGRKVFIGKATGANVGTVVNDSHLSFVEILFAMLAKAIVLIQAVIAYVNALAVAINDFPSFGTIILAFLAEFGIVVADLEIIGMVLTDRNLCVKIGVNPVRVSAKTIAARDTNVKFVAAVFLSLPEIGNALKLGNFALSNLIRQVC